MFEFLLPIVAFFTKYWSFIIEAILVIIGGFGLIAAITPTKKDDEIIGKIQKFFQGLPRRNKNDNPKIK